MWDAEFSPDGSLIATGSEDTTARLWNATTGTEILKLTGPSFTVFDVDFSPDGSRLATASGDGDIRVYVLPIDQLMKLARSRLTRSWTLNECRQYLHVGQCPPIP